MNQKTPPKPDEREWQRNEKPKMNAMLIVNGNHITIKSPVIYSELHS